MPKLCEGQGVTVGEPSGAVADFCRLLRRLVRGCQVPQSDLARALHRSEPAVSALLNAKRSTPPAWDDVLALVQLCRARKGPRPPAGMTFDASWWRLRLDEVEAGATAPRGTSPVHPKNQALLRPEAVPYTFADAVEVLVAGRRGFKGLTEELLEPLRLNGATSRDLRPLFEGFTERVRASCGVTRTALLCAADLVILVTAFCEAVAHADIVRGAEPDPAHGDLTTEIVTELERVTLGSTRTGSAAHQRQEIESAYSYAADLVFGQVASHSRRPEHVALHAWRRYEALLDRVTWDCPELHLTSHTQDPPELLEQPSAAAAATSLTRLADLLEPFAQPAKASDHHRRHLHQPIAAGEEAGPRMPTLQAGYIDPAFRIAGHNHAHSLSRDDWWQTQPLREDLADFLAAYLLTDHATQTPLLILGHPGSGKSLLTKLIAARLPASEFFCQRIELRHLPADLDIQEQIEEALWRTTGRRTAWAEAVEQASGIVRVILFDGFDELLQAVADNPDGGRHYDYLHKVEQFQRRESEQDRPTIVIATSRTLVADQARTPPAATVIRLEPFDDQRIAHWLTVWNTTNGRYFSTRGLHPLAPDVLEPHRDLAGQPLLLMMLALYDATGNALFHRKANAIDRLGLYERLLAEFVRRQITKHQETRPPHDEAETVERELQRLSVIAIGMFNRRRQDITAENAESDLSVLLGDTPQSPPLLFGRFFFIHQAQAVLTGTHLRSYEFLHATFGEYLLTRLITDEVHHLLIHSAAGGPGIDDARLYALLSHVPLSDRPEALHNIAELLAPLPPEHRAQLASLLGRLFRQATQDTSHRSHLPYRPTAPHRTQQDAIYTANLLLLAARTHLPLRISEIVGEHATLDQWHRHTWLWRSQLGDTSWNALVASLNTRPVTDKDSRDLHVGPTGTPTELNPAWALDLTSPATPPATVHATEEQPLIQRLHANAVFTWEPDLHILLHAIAPLLDQIPEAFHTHHVLDDSRSTSAAHSLIGLLFRPASHTSYTDLLFFLHAFQGEDRSLTADIAARHLRDAASALPADTALALLDALTSPQVTGSGGVKAHTWLVLTDCLVQLAARQDISHEQLRLITARFRPQAPALGNDTSACLRLLSLLKEAQSTHLWQGARRTDARTTLDAAMALLDQIPPTQQPRTLVIGLLRLARDLGADDWLEEHSEPFLLTLDSDDLQHLRPTDIDWLRPTVHDHALRAHLDRIEAAWRKS
ncbi:hypothetical protein EDD90_10947 [Streptomyces sp. Ag109_O5-1]|uniref:NACHT N-terminal helical domain 7-containing protein n=1 Tax=Streptomyces sp. Ag109_O5-1 TaxID=1938851 RepID=UPI000F515615|nr:hypothetical protein [Streptomyces sp. Ag109_O5-1]RPE26657.1 hypothetical protein EDD90_10947 [Streptomyces sp. Ag109_O5-1]